MNDGKLYVMTTCMVCLGKVTYCHYCNSGLTYVEAADKVILQWLKSIDQERKDHFLQQLKK